MKKVLSLVLAFAMILGSFGFAFANQYPGVKDTEVYSEPVNVLSGLGVVGGFPDGTFKPDDSVTRAQMAVMLMNCLGIPVSGKAATGFTDVPASHWASGYIKYAASLGYIAGMGDGTFHPDDPVTYDQALTMIVASLGYTSEGLTGDWPGNFINAARGLGLLKICKTTGSSAASRADVCCFLYQALTQPIGRTNKDGEFVPSTPTDTMIDRLGAVPYDPGYGEGEPFVVTGDEATTVNLGEYLGAYITAYADEDNTIIAIKEVLSQFVEDTVENIEKTYSKTDGSVWTDSVTYFENGEEDGTDYVDDFYSDDFIKIAVSLKNNKTINEIYSIQAWYVTEDAFAEDDVQEDIADDHKLLGEAFAEDEDGEIDMNSFVLYGRDSLEDIAEGDVVYVYTGPDSGTIKKIEIGTETVEGKITKFNTNNYTFTIGGKAYGYGVAAAISVGDLVAAMNNKAEGTFYLDYAGDIYDFEEATAETTDAYGVALRTWSEQVEDTTEDIIEIYTAEGKAEKFTLDTSFPGAGILGLYTVDEDGVVTGFDTSNTYYDSNVDISKNGLFNGNKITSSTLVIEFKGDWSDTSTMKLSKNYAIGEAADLYGETVDEMVYLLSGTTVKVVMYTSVAAEESAELAFFVDYAGEITPNGAMFTVLNNGKVEDLEVKSTVSFSTFTPYSLTIKDDLVTAVTDQSSKIKDYLGVSNLDTEATSVSGNVFTSTDGANYDLANDIIVYVCDGDGEWSVGSKADLKAKKGTLDDMWFFETSGDGAFDIAFVIEL